MVKIVTRQRGKSKTWYYSFEAGFTSAGKRKRVERGGYSTQDEAYIAGVKALAGYFSGNMAVVSERVGVAEYLQSWLDMKEALVRPTTAESYRRLLAHFLPAFGNRDLQKLRPRDVDAAMLRLAAEGLSHGTLTVALNALKSALSYAVYPCELIQANPAALIKVPRNAPRHIIGRTVIRREKLSEILAAHPFGDPLRAPILIAYHTGMRIGEICGLAWDAVDLERGTISVLRQVVRTKKLGVSFGPPKTASSARTFPISPELAAFLRRWKKRQAENELKRGGTYKYIYEGSQGQMWQIPRQDAPGDGLVRRPLVCTRESGKAVSVEVMKLALHALGVNSHSFRHTHATLCAENGAPPKGIAGRLGHSSTSITEDLYTHETGLMQMDTISAFERATKNP